LATAPPLVAGRSEGRVPPHDLEAEGSVLGSILLDPTAITRVLDLLTPEDFYRENNAQIYRAATELFRQGEPIDNITLADELTRMGVLERVGGRAHLAMLQEGVPTAANIEYYGRIVKAKAQKRRLISAGATVSGLGFDDAIEADDALNEAQRAVYDIADQRVGTRLEVLYPLLKDAMERVDAQMTRGTGVLGVPTGFHDLDRVTSGFKNSDLIVIAARPSMGKALALDQDFIPLSFSEDIELQAPMVFAGYGITAPEYHYDDYGGIDAKGCVTSLRRTTRRVCSRGRSSRPTQKSSARPSTPETTARRE